MTDHLNATRRFLRDATVKYWSDADLTAHINQALKQRDIDSGMNRLIQSVPLVIGQNLYVTNAGTFNANTVDVIGIVVIYGNARKRLAERDYGTASSVFQPTTAYSLIPAVYAKLSPTQVYLAPMPNNAYSAEWDTSIVSADLVNGSDADPLPYPWTQPVPFYAAHLAHLQLQQYDEAQQYKTLYADCLTQIANGQRGVYLPYPYPQTRSLI